MVFRCYVCFWVAWNDIRDGQMVREFAIITLAIALTLTIAGHKITTKAIFAKCEQSEEIVIKEKRYWCSKIIKGQK